MEKRRYSQEGYRDIEVEKSRRGRGRKKNWIDIIRRDCGVNNGEMVMNRKICGGQK